MGDWRKGWFPHDLHEETRRDREFPQVVAREEELARLEAVRREAVAASRRRRFLTADIYETPIASSGEPNQESTY